MSLKNLIHATLLLVATTGLSACGKNLGPFPMEVQPTRNFELRSVTGRIVDFKAEKPVLATALYVANSKRIELVFGNDTVLFEAAKFDKNLGTISASAEETGQDVGLRVTRSLVCNPSCETVIEERRRESCTYYVTDRQVVCGPNNSGQIVCSPVNVNTPRLGHQWVEYQTTIRNYSIAASMFDLSNVELAQASGSFEDKTVQTRILGGCY